MKSLLYITFLAFLGSCYSHKKLPEFEDFESVNSFNKEVNPDYTLLVFAGIGCGYSQLQLKDFQSLDTCTNLKKIIVEYEADELIRKHQDQFFTSFLFYSNKDLNLKHRNFYPQSFLYKSGDLIWKNKGYKNGLEKIIINEINCNK